MLAGKPLLDYTNLFSPNDYKKNNKTIYKYFKDKYVSSLELRLKKLNEKKDFFRRIFNK